MSDIIESNVNSKEEVNGKLYILPVKTAAVILFVSTAILTGLFGIAFIYMCWDGGYYNGTSSDDAFYGSNMCINLLQSYRYSVNKTITDNLRIEYPDTESFFSALKNNLDHLTEYYTNVLFRIDITDRDGITVFSYGAEPESFGASTGDNIQFTITHSNFTYSTYTAATNLYVRKPVVDGLDNFYEYKRYFDLFYGIRYSAIAITVLGAIVSVSLFIYLMKASGRKYGEQGVREGFCDRIPYDLYVSILIAISILVVIVPANILGYEYWDNPYIFITAISVISIPQLLLFLALSATTAVRIKTRTLFQNIVIWRLCVLVGKILRKTLRALRSIISMMPAAGKAAIGFPAFFIADAVLLSLFYRSVRYGGSFYVFFTFIMLAALNILGYIVLLRTAYELVLLRRGSGKLAGGDLDYKFDEQKLHGEAKKISQNLNSIGNGMAKAVEQRSRSERMKAELITNVSHDLKTPITSIINYIDLLKKEPMQTEAASQYLEVLDRQSARLRKLTADLVEASKASTGNIEISLAPTDICELIEQSAAEYSDRFAAAGLTPVIRIPGEPVIVNADGKLLWRVFDNLLSNVCKYSLPGTRVYLDATAGETMSCVTIRNISSAPLGDIEPEELTERFVRGDSARSGEGSGLGLSIARSLTELQGGRLTIEIDGDMFKVSAVIPVI